MTHDRLNDLYRCLFTAREVDERERVFVAQNRAHFHLPGAGHEGAATIAAHLQESDWIACHYRDKALLLARGVEPIEFFRQQLCQGPGECAGRQLPGLCSSSRHRVLSVPTLVGNHCLHAAGVAAAVKSNPDRPIVVCSVGDGTTQEGEFLEAVAEAVRWRLPVLFLIQDNRYAISTSTRGKTFFHLPTGPAQEFYGIPLQRLNGSDIPALDRDMQHLVQDVRDSRGPRIVVLELERLGNHTNADDQTQYRSAEEIEFARRTSDPVRRLRKLLLDGGQAESELAALEDSIRRLVGAAAEAASSEPEPVSCGSAKAPFPAEMLARSEYRGDGTAPQWTMREAICRVLADRLANDDRVFLYGQDIEDPKGDVFGLTRGLSTAFPGRVVNAPLSESTIVGTAIGRALAGQRPVAFLQFADFLPLAFNQIFSELGNIFWRTHGRWQCPVVVMAPCGAYKRGLGPFHAQTMEGFAAHVPSIDVVMPSTAGDAAGLLNAALESPRPTLFLYPKTCLNLPDRTTSADVTRQFVLLGRARRLQSGTDLTLVSWGGPLSLCEQAAAALNGAGYSVDVFDLRSISPWDEDAVIRSCETTGRLVVVHEDNSTGGFGAEVMAAVAERANRAVAVRRVARPDTFLPAHFGNQLELLPGLRRILDACCKLLDCELSWERDEAGPPGQHAVAAIGSGPADESVDVVTLSVSVGDVVECGQTVAELEATKSVVEVVADCAGQVSQILAHPGDRIKVGSPLLYLASASGDLAGRQVSPEIVGRPVIRRRIRSLPGPKNARSPEMLPLGVHPMSSGCCLHLTRPEIVCGSREITTASLASEIPGWTEAEAVKRTGIAQRRWIAAGETAISMTLLAAGRLLDRLGPSIPPIAAILCSTTTSQEATPSLACSVATGLRSRNCFAPNSFAVDLNAACSGFLFGLRLAADHLAAKASVSPRPADPPIDTARWPSRGVGRSPPPTSLKPVRHCAPLL